MRPEGEGCEAFSLSPVRLHSSALDFYRVFGLDLASGFPFASPLVPGSPPAALTVTLEHQPPDTGPGPFRTVYRSPFRMADGEPVARLDRQDGCEVLRFPGLADFHLRPGWIACSSPGVSRDHLAVVEIRLLGPVLAYWLERLGLPALHASAVVADGRAVAFLASEGGGKTGLAAALMQQAGSALLTDDIAALEETEEGFAVRPGYPQMRMWPDAAGHFLGRFEQLPRVHPQLAKRRVPVGPAGLGRFEGSPVPLAAVFLPARRKEGAAEVEARRIAPAEAVVELVRHSFTPHLVEAAGLQPARLGILARLAGEVPLFRLSYPSGFEHLPRVVESVLRAVPPARG